MIGGGTCSGYEETPDCYSEKVTNIIVLKVGEKYRINDNNNKDEYATLEKINKSNYFKFSNMQNFLTKQPDDTFYSGNYYYDIFKLNDQAEKAKAQAAPAQSKTVTSIMGSFFNGNNNNNIVK